MPAEITMPQLSDTMSEGTVVKWHKKEGDAIKAGEEIADVETDKAVMPLEAFDEHEGTLAKILVPEGQTVKVGQALGVIATKGENVGDVKGGGAAPEKPAAKIPEPPKSEPKPEPVEPKKPQHSSTAGKHGPEHEEGGGVPGGPLEAGRAQSRRESVKEGPERTSEILSQEAREAMSKRRADRAGPAAPRGGRVVASPLAKRIAQDKGVDLSQLNGSGPGGRIVQRDVLEAASSAGDESRALQPASVPVLASRIIGGEKQVIPLTKIRTVIANRLQQSKQNIPHFYETIDIDVEDLVALRGRLNEQLERENVRLSLGDLITKAIASALVENPAINATFDGKEITRYGDVNLGMAVALPEGLIVPVLRGVNMMGFREIRLRSADLIDRARSQRLKQDELTGATFTVSNLGTHGVREFSAIINPPEVGILAVGAAAKRAVVKGDQIVPRTMMTVTLSADHRAVDGATAADFLRTLKQLLEEPALMLV